MNIKALRRSIISAGLGALVLSFASLHAEHEMGGGMMEHLKDKLELSDAQLAKVKDLNKADGEANKLLGDKVELDLANLKVLVDKKATEEELKAAIASLKKDHKAMQEAQMKHHEAMEAILTPMQQAKLAISMGEGMRGGMHGAWGKKDWKKKDWHGKGEGKDAEDDGEKK